MISIDIFIVYQMSDRNYRPMYKHEDKWEVSIFILYKRKN